MARVEIVYTDPPQPKNVFWHKTRRKEDLKLLLHGLDQSLFSTQMASNTFETFEEKDEKERESRFSHVLQPIRDITKNWNIDIAAELEEYLQEVEQLAFSFDGGVTNLNFAEAALLIQGSACIYSRKVEYLYTLVYETLDRLARKNREREHIKSSLVRDGDDVEADLDVSVLQDEPEFLDLNDIKPAKNIDLIETYEPTSKDTTTQMRTPAALLRLEGDGEYLIDRKGEKIGSKRDFKMNTMMMHGTSALVHIHEYSRIDMTFNAAKQNMSILDSFAYDAHNNMTGISLANMTHLSVADANTTTHLANDIATVDGDQSSDDDMGMDMGSDDAGMDINVNMGNGEETVTTFTADHAMDTPQTRILGPDARAAVNLVNAWDPWTPLDPHDDGGRKPKPFKKGKPYRVPAQIRAIQKGEEVKVSNIEPVGEFMDSFSDDPAMRLPKNWLLAPLFPENAGLYFEYRKMQQQRLAERRAQALREAQLASQSEADRTLRLDEIERVFDDNLDGGGGQYEADFDMDHGADSDDDMGMDHYEPLDLGALTQTGAASYEDMVRDHINMFLASAETYADHSDLAVRVRAWEERIRPILEAEEQHDPFDIHEYGEVVLEDGFDNHKENDVIPFEELVANKEPYEICRLFLATLQLANQGNVEIVVGHGEPSNGRKRSKGATSSQESPSDGPCPMRLKLLSRDKAYDFDNYRAPSAGDSHPKTVSRAIAEPYGENTPLPIA